MRIYSFSIHKHLEGKNRIAYLKCRHDKEGDLGVCVLVRGCDSCVFSANANTIGRGRRSECRFKQTAPDPRSLEEL